MIQTSALAAFLAHRPASPCTAGHRVYSQIWITAAVVHFSGSIPHQKQMLEAKFSVQDCTTIWGACRDNGVRSHTCARECRRARHLPKCSLEMLTGAFLSLPVNPSTLVVSSHTPGPSPDTITPMMSAQEVKGDQSLVGRDDVNQFRWAFKRWKQEVSTLIF